MAQIIEITDFTREELSPYVRLTEAQLRSKRDPSQALFIAESAKVISHALDAGYTPVSMLLERVKAPEHCGHPAAPVRRDPRVHRRSGAAGGAHRVCIDPGYSLCHAPSRAHGCRRHL